jgi:hypothetical protein
VRPQQPQDDEGKPTHHAVDVGRDPEPRNGESRDGETDEEREEDEEHAESEQAASLFYQGSTSESALRRFHAA